MSTYSRRQALQLLGASSLLWHTRSFAKAATPPAIPVLSGEVIDLVIEQRWLDLNGKPILATLANGNYPAPTLRLREGDTVTIRVHNKMPVPTAIHWHGLLVPYQMDGVPNISFAGIAAGEMFEYRFTLQQHGTYWYHAHAGFQEQTGLIGALIIDPKETPQITLPEHTLLFSDWTSTSPELLLRRLKIHSEFDQRQQTTLAQLLHDTKRMGLSEALSKRQMWNQMRMSPTDFSDLSASFEYGVNGLISGDHRPYWWGWIESKQPIRLRLINGSAQTIFDLRIPELRMQVVAADGLAVEPITVDELRIGAGETYDVIITPQDDAYVVFAQTIDRRSFTAASLSVRPDIHAPIPAIDPPHWLDMVDMMGSMQTPNQPVRHAHTEYGASVDMRVDTPRSNLDDAGVHLRHHQRLYGRRVLTYADLHTLDADDQREPSRELELHLTGNMHRYQWGFDGLSVEHAKPIQVRTGERIRVRLVNDTMMLHPMHLHGMWSDIQRPDGGLQVRKHTILIQPAQDIRFDFTGIQGRWAWHCHFLYHMHAGMMRELEVI